MDCWIASAGRLLAAGDPLGALKRVALRKDPAALALRGIAMAQWGDFEMARRLMRRAAKGFGPRERLGRARCQLAEAEIALAAKDLTRPLRHLPRIARCLIRSGDLANGVHAYLTQSRLHLLEGRLGEAQKFLEQAESITTSLKPSLAARLELTRAELELRRLRIQQAKAAFDRALHWAKGSGISSLLAEVQCMRVTLTQPAAHLIESQHARAVVLEEVQDALNSGRLVVDACRRVLRKNTMTITLATRPVLFNLVRALGEAYPSVLSRDSLIRKVFKARVINASHRARLRVELGRLRAKVQRWARIVAREDGYALVPKRAPGVVVLAPFQDGVEGWIVALLQGGDAWSTSALATAVGVSQRNIQRWLIPMLKAGEVRVVGRGRSRRWLAPPLQGITTTLLLPASLTLH